MCFASDTHATTFSSSNLSSGVAVVVKFSDGILNIAKVRGFKVSQNNFCKGSGFHS